jgi:hypothetical protein
MSVNVPDKGDLYNNSMPTKENVYDVRGDTHGFGNAGTKTGFNEDAPVWLEGRSVDQDATNVLGGITGDTNSDPMFDKFNRQDRSGPDRNQQDGGTNTPETVASDKITGSKWGVGAHSDSVFAHYPSTDSEEDVGSKT